MLRALVYIVPVALALYALIDLSRSEAVERADIHRAAWVALIVLLPVIGPVTWILISRSRRAPASRPTPGSRPAPPNGPRPGPAGRVWPVRRPGPVAPDDDPDFLWRLEQQQRRRRAGPGGRKKSPPPLPPDSASPGDDAATGPAGSDPVPPDDTP